MTRDDSAVAMSSIINQHIHFAFILYKLTVMDKRGWMIVQSVV